MRRTSNPLCNAVELEHAFKYSCWWTKYHICHLILNLNVQSVCLVPSVIGRVLVFIEETLPRWIRRGSYQKVGVFSA